MSCSRGPLHEYAPWLIAGFCYLMAVLFIAYETSVTRGWLHDQFNHVRFWYIVVWAILLGAFIVWVAS